MTRDFDYITLVSMRFVSTPVMICSILCVLGGCSTPKKHVHDAPLLPGMSPEIPIPKEDLMAGEEEGTEIPDLDQPGKGGGVNGVDSEEDPDIATEPENIRKKRQIPFEFNQRVAKWIEYFSQKDRERFQRFFDRGEPYREVIQNILEENRVPTDLYYLGMIESGFNAHAKSSAKAVGVWQFMKTTGRLYGLAADAYVDQRRDPIRATEAAAKMLRDLYRQFDSWYLAMAAYNAGPGRIRGAIRRAKTRDFWELVEKNRLPRETMDYVPKFLAARYIGENPELFGFYINEEKKYPDVELITVPSPIPFQAIENACSIPEGTLQFVNPHYLKSHTHPGRKMDEIWVPEEYRKSLESRIPDLAQYRIKVRPERGAGDEVERLSRAQVVIVRRGDTLKSIASRRGLSVAYLKRVNGLRGSVIMPGQRLKVSAASYHQNRTHPRKGKKRRL
ncbi:MAG: transglycosylase SLT domain-containing protein [Bdellovibrionales bacterium]|nr:transglycosylase SLT domain-containing protein [Bdellovibrionales bacterium]